MKVCKYCNTKNSDEAVFCSSCRGNDFSYICPNCGRVHDSAYCPNCGTRYDAAAKVCPECGEKYFTHACPNCGYVPSKETVTERVVYVEQPKPKKRSGWATFGLVLLWIYFLPVMGTIATWKSKTLPKWAKIAITSAIWILMLIAFIRSKQQGV